jgi:DNA-binding NtrC family response regulator
VDTAVVLSTEGRIGVGPIDAQLGVRPVRDETLLPVPLHRSKDEAEREMIYASILALHRDVREILAMVKRAAGGGPLEAMKEVFPDGGRAEATAQTLSQLERSAIRDALRVCGGNRRKAAEMLGISERTLYRKIKEYGLI